MKLLLCLLLVCSLSAMEKEEQPQKHPDLEAQNSCCNPEEPEVKESCTKMKVAIITGVTGLVSTGITAATILIVQNAQVGS